MEDPFNLGRFVAAQDARYPYSRVLGELRTGKKEGHWIWWVFPQLSELGASPTAKEYGIASLEEARAYLAHPVLGPRLRECARLLAAIAAPQPLAAMVGGIDAVKIRSSMTLFAAAATDDDADFQAVLDRYFDGQPDPLTREILRNS